MKKRPPGYLTVAEIADALGCSDSYAYQLIPTLPGAWKLGTRWRLTRADLEAYIAEQRAAYAEQQDARHRRLTRPAPLKNRKAPVPKAATGTAGRAAGTIRPSHAAPVAPCRGAEAVVAQDRSERSPTLHIPRARHFSPLRDQLRASLNAMPEAKKR